MFPKLVGWIKNRQLILKNAEMSIRDIKDLIKHLKESLNPNICRGLVDCFLIRKQKEEVRTHLLHFSSNQKRRNMFCLFYWSLVCALHLRTLVSQTLTTVRQIWYLQWPTCLLLVLIPQQLHWDGVCCLWPNIHIYRVREEINLLLNLSSLLCTFCFYPWVSWNTLHFHLSFCIMPKIVTVNIHLLFYLQIRSKRSWAGR